MGGTNRAVTIICKESFLHSSSLRGIIHAYAPFPLLARIHPSLVDAIASQWNANSELEVSFVALPEHSVIQTAVSTFKNAFSALKSSLFSTPLPSESVAESSLPNDLADAEKLVQYLFTSLQSPHASSSSLQQTLQGSPQSVLRTIVSQLQSNRVERVEVKGKFVLASLRSERSSFFFVLRCSICVFISLVFTTPLSTHFTPPYPSTLPLHPQDASTTTCASTSRTASTTRTARTRNC